MAELMLYGIIGSAEDGLDAKTVCAAIRASAGPLTVSINSPGGLVAEGMAIVEALRSYAGPLTIRIDGLAASMGSVIAMVGDNCAMAESALMMIHRPWDIVSGGSPALRASADVLDKWEALMVGIYAKRTGLDPADLSVMLAAETWMDAQEALAAGFVTSISQPLKLAAMAKATGYGFRHLPDRLKDETMPDTPDTATALAAERTRASTIMALCEKHNLGSAMAATLIGENVPLDRARAIMLEQLAERSDSVRIGNLFTEGRTLDNPAFATKAMGDALYARMSGKMPEGAAREFMSFTMVDIARDIAERRGVKGVRTMRADQVLNAAAWNGPGSPKASAGGSIWTSSAEIVTTTSDFPDMLTATGQRFLLDTYQAYPSPLKMIGRAREARDFRPISALQLSNFGILNQTAEGGEIKHGHFTARSDTYKLDTFTKQWTMTLQMIVNDDLNAFGDIMRIMASAAAETEAQVLAAIVLSNPVLDDGLPVFSAGHTNLRSAYVMPTPAAFSDARSAMRSHKDADGVTPIGSAPKFVLSGASQETLIEQAIVGVTAPVTSDQVNVFAGRLTPLVDPRIPDNSWFMVADPALAPVLEYANLQGQNGPAVEQQQAWNTLGQAFRVYNHFGAGFVDWRGIYKVPTA